MKFIVTEVKCNNKTHFEMKNLGIRNVGTILICSGVAQTGVDFQPPTKLFTMPGNGRIIDECFNRLICKRISRNF